MTNPCTLQRRLVELVVVSSLVFGIVAILKVARPAIKRTQAEARANDWKLDSVVMDFIITSKDDVR